MANFVFSIEKSIYLGDSFPKTGIFFLRYLNEPKVLVIVNGGLIMSHASSKLKILEPHAMYV